ncbi:DUF5710 domain-containing protein [Burkholderia sp. LMG 13014]|uniref:DUF5710 domain-containing protein n=1 Tax=Burkholderia sp. LMG 13014 TaxID=2709306 RepID=UPI00196575F5|nr:DUF5710 domain-containing protein [Burkholderia sp. LMG 13014]
MRFPIGFEQYAYEKQGGKTVPVDWDASKVVNPHMMVAGKSGTGKSHFIRRAIYGGAQSGGGRVRFLVFDRHGDLGTPGESVIRFSPATPYGCTNPLEVNPDPHFGGVRRAIDRFVSGIDRSSKLGTRQRPALRRVLGELYASRGYTKDPATWVPEDPAVIAERLRGKEDRVFVDVPYSQREVAKGMGARWDPDLQCWWFTQDKYVDDALVWPSKVLFRTSPTVEDAVQFVRDKLATMYLGANSAVMGHVTEVNRFAARYHKLVIESARLGRTFESEELLEKAAAAREKAVTAFEAYLNSVETGRELDEVIDFKGSDVMTAVADRMSTLADSGIFGQHADFDPACPVWRFDISALSIPETRMFVHFKMAERYDAAIQRGEQDSVREIVVLDEAGIHFNDDDDNMPNRYANETRKFGLALWAVTQSPEKFTDEFLGNIGTKMIFRMDQTYYDRAARKLKIERQKLEYLRAKHNALSMVENADDARTAYRLVMIPKESPRG